MKKILIILALVTGLIACENQQKEFPDYLFTSGYFPYQYPVRTLVLGDYIYDNTNDNNHKFLISIAMGGIYTNDKDRVFNIELAPALCTKALFASTNDPIELMPPSYYTLSSSTQLIVPKDKVNGAIEVQLTDAFFNDPKAIKLAYVIPIRIVSSADVDTILRGNSSKNNPDPRVTAPGEWNITPKDFTMFAVNFINPYHGTYLHRGVNTVKNSSGTILETNVYRTQYIEKNELWKLITSAKNIVQVSGTTKSALVPGTLKMDLTFADNGDCTIKQSTGSTYTITGTGKFTKGADTWGDKPRDAIHMTYQLTSGAYSYSATDTLVIRDRAVVMQVFTPKVIP
jgi:hypothetical protein